MGKIMGLSDFLGGTSQNRRENFYVFNPSPQKQLFLRCFPYIAPRHPVILRDTAGEKGYKQTDEMSFFNTISKNDVVFLTPLIVATAPLSLPYIANATPRNTTGHGRGEVLILLITGTERYVFSSSSLWRQQ